MKLRTLKHLGQAPVPGVMTYTQPITAIEVTPDMNWAANKAAQINAVASQSSGMPIMMPGQPGQPGMPGMPSNQQAINQVIAQLQRGVQAFQDLTVAHPNFRLTGLIVPHFKSEVDEDDFFYNHADDLTNLKNMLATIPDSQVVAMFTWLYGIVSPLSYPPDQWVLIVEKLILKENISFPPLELSTRIINFLSAVLSRTQNGSQEKSIQDQQDSIRQTLYKELDLVSSAAANYDLAKNDANLPINQDPLAWAESIIQNFALSFVPELPGDTIDVYQVCEYLLFTQPASQGPAFDTFKNSYLNYRDAQLAYAKQVTPLITQQQNLGQTIAGLDSTDPNNKTLIAATNNQINDIQNQIQALIVKNPDFEPDNQNRVDNPIVFWELLSNYLSSVVRTIPGQFTVWPNANDFANAAFITHASTVLNNATQDLQDTQNTIQTLNEEMASLEALTLTPTQLLTYMQSNLTVGDSLNTLNSEYQKIKDTISLYHSLLDPLYNQETSLFNQLSPLQTQYANAQAAFFKAQAVLNYTAEIHQTPSTDQISAYNSAQAAVSAALNPLTPIQNQIASVQNQIATIFSAHPEFKPDGTNTILDDVVLSNLILDVITKVLDKNPWDMITLIESAMSADAAAADSRIKDLENEQAEMIQAKQDAFQKFYQDQAESRLQYYKDQITSAQNQYNQFSNILEGLIYNAQSLQDQINANVNALGKVIGYWCYENRIPDSSMNAPSFISAALHGVIKVNGAYDVLTFTADLLVTTMSQSQVMFEGPGRSVDLAEQTLDLMNKRVIAEQQYNEQQAALSAEIKSMGDWIKTLTDSFKTEQTLVNSQSYAQSLLPLFLASPQGMLIQSDIDYIQKPFNQISLQVQTDQKTFQGILDDIESKILSDNGYDISRVSGLDYESKKNLWVGVCNHLAGPGQRLDELNGYISQLSAKINVPNPSVDDVNSANVAKHALMNIIAAQNIQRNLELDIDFMAALNSDATDDYKAATNATQIAAQNSAQNGSAAPAMPGEAFSSQLSASSQRGTN